MKTNLTNEQDEQEFYANGETVAVTPIDGEDTFSPFVGTVVGYHNNCVAGESFVMVMDDYNETFELYGSQVKRV